MHGIRHDQARANKGVDLIESPRAPPTEARREHQGRSIDFPRVHHTDLLHADITPPLNSGYRAACTGS